MPPAYATTSPSESPEYVRELAQHHTGGYLKIAPEAIAPGPLSMMMKPGVGTYDRFKELFDRYSREAGKEQYLIPYFIAAHPGTSDEDMLELAVWLKRNGYRADQVQAFLPSPMATATAMYHSGKNPLRRVDADERTGACTERGSKCGVCTKRSCATTTPTTGRCCAKRLRRMGRADLIGNGKRHLVPAYQPLNAGHAPEGRRNLGASFMTQHTSEDPEEDPEARLTMCWLTVVCSLVLGFSVPQDPLPSADAVLVVKSERKLVLLKNGTDVSRVSDLAGWATCRPQMGRRRSAHTRRTLRARLAQPDEPLLSIDSCVVSRSRGPRRTRAWPVSIRAGPS